MEHRPPRPADSATPADWLTARVNLWGPHWVTNVVGSGFEDYARLFHPLDDYPGALRWASIARVNDRIMHPSAQWAHISSPAPFTIEHTQRGRSHPGEPMWGHLSTKSVLRPDPANCALPALDTALMVAPAPTIRCIVEYNTVPAAEEYRLSQGAADTTL